MITYSNKIEYKNKPNNNNSFSNKDANEVKSEVNSNITSVSNRLAGTDVLLATATIIGDDTPTINAPSGKVITAVTATAAGASKTITITNSFATATSIVMASIGDYGGNGTPLLKEITPGAGTIVIEIYNAHASAALSAAFDVNFAIIG